MSNVLLGVCGGIAAYKSAEIVRELQRHDAEVRVIMTRSAQEFVQPLTFASLSGHRVFTDLWESPAISGEIEHIEQAQWAEVLLIAPATANTLAKFAYGLAGDFLSATYLATEAPVVVAPAMNVNMLHHPATSANLLALEQRGHTIIAAESGYLACGMTGDGRLADTESIVRAVLDRLHRSRDLDGEIILITAGGTREPIDPVRFLGNRSSGRMGYALAVAAERRGARVILVSAARALDAPPRCEVVRVDTAHEMHAVVLARLSEATVVIKAAAVADFRVSHVASAKLHRDSPVILELEPTEDIVRSVVDLRRQGTMVIAFAAEMGLDIDRAREKLHRKGVDAIVLNDISRSDIGFESDRNAAVFITDEVEVHFKESTKDDLAAQILDQVIAIKVRQQAQRQLDQAIPNPI